MYEDNYYLRRYKCTRNQFRRIVNDCVYNSILDGDEDEYKLRVVQINKRKMNRGDI